MYVAIDNSSLLLAVADHVLTEAEALELEALAESDAAVPDYLLDAVERFCLYACDASDTQH